MRALLRKEWPALTKFYEGALMPWHAGGPPELTLAELAEYRQQAHRALKEEAKAARSKRR